ncbi:GNAT family N-acetyltransferase [Thiobacillus sp.]|uniref:GNAT family N-acetyltransferase n=1 Tax=Thiobacillus sp. TaxID=924 RepID=UPI0011D450F4|nr:GNAT family N-acetyltransferase [Thiobacillus sp.]TXH75734.1 MAG: N-acetyltransferase [Thiobacillus sp.]
MNEIDFIKLDQVDRKALTDLLNNERIRRHLADHPAFDPTSLEKWLLNKIETDAIPGSRLRAVYIGDRFAGWCGIQPLDGQPEVALVLDDAYWGRGREIFRELMSWARELGHESVSLCFPLSRREYGFLTRRSRRTYRREWMGQQFRVYELEVSGIASYRTEKRHARQ